MPPLQTFEIPVPVRLSLLWTTLIALFLYNDYFSLYVPGTVEMMSEGVMGPLGPATDGVMVGVALLMAVPAAMIYLSVALPPGWSRRANLWVGGVFLGLNLATLIGSPLFYRIVVGIETVLTLVLMRTAYRWPRAG